MSASEILDKMLSAMPESYQKTIGFPTYDLLAAVSLRMEGTDTTIDEARQQLDPENLHDSALDRYIYPRSGLERKAATFAHGSLTVTGTGTVEQGTLFESGGGVQYYATETVAIEGEGTVPVTCTVDGTAGNLPAHSVTQMPVAVQGIASCDNPEPIGGGYAEESDSEYYARYLVVLRTPATSGKAITVSCTVSKSDTVTEDILTSGIKESVEAYLAGTVFTQDYISYAQIGAAIMDTPGVIDYAGLKVSGGIVNIAIAERECPVLGEVTITYG